ncbi:hypothetical protein [Flavobacterium chungangense]|uniref:Uncharacterized protein n=1 Tax=Flavobacterium chungangense TaxID=554283 RepID=A0A6V6Z6X6_9FLAO|nr:hypothetical protein [Flavobacterium chungangense]CAD0007531.1 hypothetical protein FLACHUCJ7_03360 [Flavobacterium chungangense]
MKKMNDKSVSIIIKKHLYSHEAELKLGDWKNQFHLNYVKTLIAMALNHCTENDNLIINGYLITDKTLYLIVKTNDKNFDSSLKKIENNIHFLLENHTKELKTIDRYSFETHEEKLYFIRKPLFKMYPLKNEHLIQLLTGKKVTLPYFDRKLEDLKLLIRNHPFCSAVDYAGAIGPVDIALLNV